MVYTVIQRLKNSFVSRRQMSIQEFIGRVEVNEF